MKIILLGSPTIALPAFQKVINNFDVIAIVTQPDSKQGRGMIIQQTAVADLGDKNNIKVFKPHKIIEIKEELKALDFDVMLTFAFGQFIPTSILSLGTLPPINIHGSLLPKYRGAGPIHHAILNGDKKIGITLMEMIKEMDAGQMFFKSSINIDDKTTTGDAFKIIEKLAQDNIVEWLHEYSKKQVGEKQGPNFTLAPKIEKSFAELKPKLTIEQATRKIRGLNPFPCAFMIIDNKRLKVFDVTLNETKNLIQLKFSDGVLWANDYQWENKKRIKF